MAKVEIIPLFPPSNPVELNGLQDNDPSINEGIEIHIIPKSRVNYYGYVFKNYKVYEHFISPRHRGTITWKNILANYFKKKVIRVDYPVISIAHGWFDNYYHFTLEVLVKIYLLSERYKDAVILFPAKLNGFHKSWFELLGITNIQFIEESQIVLSPKVISCNFPNRDLNHHSEITPLFREWILEKAKNKGIIDLPKFKNELFIDREKASYRKILNHKEFKIQLQQTNIQVLNFEDLSLEEQLNAMYFATEVSFVHGAGLTNILFCKPDTIIKDFCHKDFNQLCFYKLAKTIHLDYEYIPCDGNKVHELPGYCDLFIPLNMLSKENYD